MKVILSDMDSTFLQLLLLPSLAFAIPVIDSGGRVSGIGPEQIVTDFAVLTGNNLTNLPQDLTLCSSLASGLGPMAFSGPCLHFSYCTRTGDHGFQFTFIQRNRRTQHITG